MAFCNKCGNQLPDGANNCPKCGAPVGGTQQNAQGFVLFLFGIAVSLATFIISIIPVVGWILGPIIGFVASVFELILMIMGIINAAQGQAKELPLIGKIILLK